MLKKCIIVILKSDDIHQREAIAKQLVGVDNPSDLYEPKTVLRHIQVSLTLLFRNCWKYYTIFEKRFEIVGNR